MVKSIIINILAIVISAQVALPQGYGGPSMLSRGGNRPGQRGRAPVGFVVYGAVRGTLMESGLTPVQLEEDGTLVRDDTYGVQAEIGTYGTHSWRRTTLGLDYRGDYRYATYNSRYNGTNQALSLELLHTINRRTGVFFRQTGGTTNRAFGGFLAPSVTDPLSLNLTNDEVFDTRSYFAQTTAGVSYRSSARFTHTLSGDGFFTKRPDPRLISVWGYRASADSDYRITSRTTIGARYQYMIFEFPRAFSGSDMHGAAFKFSTRLTRNIDVNLMGGAIHLSTFGTQRVVLSPEVAALLGRLTGIEAYARTEWVPQFSGTVSYVLERSKFTAAYASILSPGNGVYLTSQRRAASVGYSFTGVRKLSMGISARYSQLISKASRERNLALIGGGGGLEYALTRHVNLSSQLDYRSFQSGGVRGREGFYFAVGLSVSPARIPLSIW